METKEEYIYFIQQGDDGPIKIGYSTDVTERIRRMRTCSPYEIYIRLVISGNLDFEKNIHKKFKKYKMRGEWFQNTKEIREYIKSLGGVLSIDNKGDSIYPEFGDKVVIIKGPFTGLVGEYDNHEESGFDENAVIIPHNREDLGILQIDINKCRVFNGN